MTDSLTRIPILPGLKVPEARVATGQRCGPLTARHQLQAEMEVDEEAQGKLVKEALRADSVALLLGQALQAQDRALLERCRPLSCKECTRCRKHQSSGTKSEALFLRLRGKGASGVLNEVACVSVSLQAEHTQPGQACIGMCFAGNAMRITSGRLS